MICFLWAVQIVFIPFIIVLRYYGPRRVSVAVDGGFHTICLLLSFFPGWGLVFLFVFALSSNGDVEYREKAELRNIPGVGRRWCNLEHQIYYPILSDKRVRFRESAELQVWDYQKGLPTSLRKKTERTN